MTLVVEDGSGISTAESYISVAAAGTRHTNLGNTAWTGTDAAKESALRRATAHMEQAYRTRWKGTRLTRAQALSWPRYGAIADGWDVPSTEVPTDVANACADLALKALADELAPDVTRVAIREKVGPLEREYSPYSPQSPQYRAVDLALAPYLFGGASTSRLVRA
jgi:hypothetical protein